MGNNTIEPFTYATSEALSIPLSIRIVNVEGEQTPIPFSTLLKRPDLRYIGSNLSPHSDLYVTVQLWADSKPLTVPVQTAYKSFRNERRWNEWLEVPIYFSQLPISSQLAITVWDLSPTERKAGWSCISPADWLENKSHHIPFGGTTVRLFDQENHLLKGRQKCHLHRGKAADGLDSSSTPSIISPPRRIEANGKVEEDKEAEEMDRLEKLFKKHEMGELPSAPWLDSLVFRAVEKRGLQASSASLRTLQRTRNRHPSTVLSLDGAPVEGDHKAEDDPIAQEKFVLFIELPRFDFPIIFQDPEYPPPLISSLQHLSSSNLMPRPIPEVRFGPGINAGDSMANGMEPGGRLFKFYDPEVGAKDNPAESKHRRLVRSHRGGILDRDLKPNAASRDELNRIMTYDPTHPLTPDEKDTVWRYRHHLTRDKRALTKFVKSVQWSDPSESKQAVQILEKWTEIDVDDALELLGRGFDNPAVRAYAVERLRGFDDDELLLYLLQLVQALKFEHILPDSPEGTRQDSSLASFLIARASKNFLLGNYFHWYLLVEVDDNSEEQGEVYRRLFAKVEYDFMTELMKLPGGESTRRVLLKQAELITVLAKISGEVKTVRDSIPRKTERLKHYLADSKNNLLILDPPVPLPLDPSVQVTGVYPDESTVFKSSLSPIMVTFKTSTGRKYPIIFKTGDDLRQDQLVIQIITLMDQLLRKENLDLKLSPYKILATNATAGAVQFVRSISLQGAATKYKNNPVLTYLRINNPDDKAPLGIRPETLDTFIKSCAGYCVITYLLGVGDRHLDNLLLTPDGHFFHIDFGFILGRDPKPFAPAMKLCKEMVDGMGGSNSVHYQRFKQYCFTAFSTLRKQSNLILNLFSLMVDANIPDIRLEPDKVVLKVKERFHLELGDEDALRYFDRLIEDSANAIFPVVIDKLHGFVQNFR